MTDPEWLEPKWEAEDCDYYYWVARHEPMTDQERVDAQKLAAQISAEYRARMGHDQP